MRHTYASYAQGSNKCSLCMKCKVSGLLSTRGALYFQKASMRICIFKLRIGGFKMKCKPWGLLWPPLPLPFPNGHSLGSLLLCSVVACACTLRSSCSQLLLWAGTTIALWSFVISVAAFLKWCYSHLGGL